MRNIDFSSWQAMLSTLIGLAVITLIGVGIRLLAQQTIQQRRERENRQINERLRTLIAAYKTLGGSFTGNLAVDPTHLRDLRSRDRAAETQAKVIGSDAAAQLSHDTSATSGSDRARRMRDAVEAALSDVILLGTEDQVRLAARAATELAQGRPTATAELVVSLRDFIRKVLDLDPFPVGLSIPDQGPTRPSGGARGKDAGGARDEPKPAGGARGGSGDGGGGSIGIGGASALGTGLGTNGVHDGDVHPS